MQEIENLFSMIIGEQTRQNEEESEEQVDVEVEPIETSPSPEL